MIRRLITAFVICLLALGGLKFQNNINNLQQQLSYTNFQTVYGLQYIIQKVLPSVVYVENNYSGWTGSGVIVGSHAVLTAKHVIDDANSFTITVVDGNNYEAINWIVDPNNDCGLLFFKEELGPIVRFADSNNLNLGERIFIIGSPYGYDFFNTVTVGIISGLERDISFFGEDPVITVDAASSPGNSGGPVFNMQGYIIGILVGGMRYDDNWSIVISTDTCKQLLNNEKQKINKITDPVGIGDFNSPG